ncbi:MAG: SigE family RNA polymerase sigma factor [Candidatus Nanopelagicales bacterium]
MADVVELRGTPFPESARDAVSALFVAHHRRLVGLASLLVDDRESAEEIVQDAFESLYKRWNGLRDPSAAVAYLDRAVVYGARSWVRRRVVARSFVPPEAGAEESAETLGVEQVRRSELSAAIRALPRRQREVVVLRYFLDLTEGEIAQWLGVSPGSVKQHASRATAALQKRMEAWA